MRTIEGRVIRNHRGKLAALVAERVLTIIRPRRLCARAFVIWHVSACFTRVLTRTTIAYRHGPGHTADHSLLSGAVQQGWLTT